MFRNISVCSVMVILFFSIHATTYAQGRSSEEVDYLTQRILDNIPDIPSTRDTFGRGAERPARAREHAVAIFAAADSHAARWTALANENGWDVFDARRDLPALIAAIAYNESRFRNVVRLDGGRNVYELAFETRTEGSRRFRRVMTSDIGIMQVRAPSRTAASCGVEDLASTERLLSDMAFNYRVGACVLTNLIANSAESYREGSPRRRMRVGMRPTTVLRFFGAYGPREGTLDARRAGELLVIERYNWGGADFYLDGGHATYGMRILRMMEEFAPPFEETELSGG